MESSAPVAPVAPPSALDPRRWKALALLLLGRPRTSAQERLEPVPATGAAE